jgi:ABC-type antimicrobial peptide transport system permease subunit
MSTKPPRWGETLLKIFCPQEEHREILGDFEELYNLKVAKKGKLRACFWYLLQIFQLIRSGSELSFYWNFAIFRNYLTVVFRNLRRQKAYSLINMSGLALGLSVFFFISVWVVHEIGYDRFHEKASFIYRVNEIRTFPDDVQYSYRTPGPLSQMIEESFPEIKEAVRFAWTGERVIRYKNRVYYESAIITADPAFLEIFTFPLIEGDPKSALDDLYSIIITESVAHKYFEGEDPVGRILSLDNRFDFTVTGVMKDVPSNSHIQFDMIVPFDIVGKLGWAARAWNFSLASTYILLEKNVDVQALGTKIAGIVKAHDADTNIELFLQPLTKIHLFSNFENPRAQGRILYVYIFSFIGLLILLIACINFMNLSTARSEQRAKEIGIRKVVGAFRRHLIRQFLFEAVFFAGIGLALALILVQAFLPGFNEVSGESFSLSNLTEGPLLLLILGVTLITGILSGSYPALFLSSFKPVDVFRGKRKAGSKGVLLRKTLVWFQMSVSIFLIIGTSVIYTQIDYLKNKELGFDKEHVVSLPLGIANAENPHIYARLKNELIRDPHVQVVSASFTHPTWFATAADRVRHNGRRLDEKIPVNITSVEYDFIETLNIKILKGRSFSNDYGSERGNVIINETFERLMGVESALNETLTIGDEYQGQIIGVMKDFHMESVAAGRIGPLILFLNPRINYIFVRIFPNEISSAMAALEKAWEKAAPNLPFNANFLDEEFDGLYQDVERVGTILKYFTYVAGLIACLGLIGLASFAAEKRTKEIGVRKVLGSSVSGIVVLLSQDFVKLILLANLCAWPVAWFVMQYWLGKFPYHVNLSWTVFILSGLLAMVVTLAAVGYQTLRASLADPVRSLRYE